MSSYLTVEPLTLLRWPLLDDLFSAAGPVGRCWCMAPRIGAAYRRRPPADNRADLRAAVTAGPPPGLLALRDDTAVGWCGMTPRDAVPALDDAWRTRRVDDVPVWAITCFYIRKGHRRSGLMTALVDAAVSHARDAGAPAVEAYPLDGAVSPSATSTGYASTFLSAGFVEIARRSPERPIMRLTF